jgi:hypothetical protein
LIKHFERKRRISSMARGVVLAVVTAAWIMLSAHTGAAQPADEVKALRKDVEALKQGQTAIQKDLQEIKTLLQARPAAPAAAAPAQDALVSIDGAPSKGSKTAKVVMVDFTDYQ